MLKAGVTAAWTLESAARHPSRTAVDRDAKTKSQRALAALRAGVATAYEKLGQL